MVLGIIGSLLAIYKYAFLVPAALIEGPLISLFTGSFIRFGLLDLVPGYTALVAGEFLGDLIWYWIGSHHGHKFVSRYGKYVSLTEKNVEEVKRLFSRQYFPILFISKLVNGVGMAIPILFTAGLARVPFWRYAAVNLVGQMIWSALLVYIGYSFSSVFVETNNFIQRVSLIGFGIVIIAIFIGASRYIRKVLFLKTDDAA